MTRLLYERFIEHKFAVIGEFKKYRVPQHHADHVLFYPFIVLLQHFLKYF